MLFVKLKLWVAYQISEFRKEVYIIREFRRKRRSPNHPILYYILTDLLYIFRRLRLFIWRLVLDSNFITTLTTHIIHQCKFIFSLFLIFIFAYNIFWLKTFTYVQYMIFYIVCLIILLFIYNGLDRTQINLTKRNIYYLNLMVIHINIIILLFCPFEYMDKILSLLV